MAIISNAMAAGNVIDKAKEEYMNDPAAQAAKAKEMEELSKGVSQTIKPAATSRDVYGYNPAAHTAENIAVDANKSTVAGQMDSLMKQNSDYMRNAVLGSKEQAASRGLINSSIAAASGRRAAIESALPIAQQDASTYFDTQKLNMDANNRFKENTQAYDIKKSLSNQDRINTQSNMTLEQQFNLAKMAREQGYDLQKLNAQQQDEIERLAASHGYDMSKMDQQQKNDVAKMILEQTNTKEIKAIDQANTIALNEQNFKNDIAKMGKQNEYDQTMAELNSSLAMVETEQKATLEAWLDEIKTSNKLDAEQKLSFTNTMNDIMKDAQTAINAVGTTTAGKNNNLITPEQQQWATQQIINQRDAQIDFLRTMYLSGGDLDFDFPTVGGTGTATGTGTNTGTTTPAPTGTATAPAPTGTTAPPPTNQQTGFFGNEA